MTRVTSPVVAAPVALVVAAMLLGVAGCGGTGQATDQAGRPAPSGGAPTSSTDPTFTPSVQAPDYGTDPVQFRVVVEPTDENVPAALRERYDALTCPGTPRTVAPGRPMVACDRDGFKYLLRPADLVGGVRSAAPVVPPNAEDWSVEVRLDRRAAARFAGLSARMARVPGGRQQLAFVLGGVVVTAPVIGTRVTGGRLQVSGAFTEQDAQSVAQGLSAGG